MAQDQRSKPLVLLAVSMVGFAISLIAVALLSLWLYQRWSPAPRASRQIPMIRQIRMLQAKKAPQRTKKARPKPAKRQPR